MPITVLFDLDDTLLHTNMGQFMPAYFASLGRVFSHLATPDALKQQIEFAVQKMIANQDPSRMLEEIFSENFYPPLGTSKEDCQEVLDTFYREEFPKLKHHTQPKPEAQELVNWCRAESMLIAIATNPLFPETATRQRIEWAGLYPENFAYFSTYNNFHFTKPNLSYYAECMGRLGWPENPMAMIGDNLSYDLLPVEAMGYQTFYISPNGSMPNRANGALSDVKGWLREMKHKNDAVKPVNSPEVITAVLRSTPAVFDTWLRQKPMETLCRKPSKHSWSVVEVLWHLADYENEVHKPQWQQLCANPAKSITPVDTSNWAQDRNYQSRDPLEAMAVFQSARLESLSSIQHLLEDGLFGKPVHHMVFTESKIEELVYFAAKHDRIHLGQCANLLNIS